MNTTEHTIKLPALPTPDKNHKWGDVEMRLPKEGDHYLSDMGQWWCASINYSKQKHLTTRQIPMTHPEVVEAQAIKVGDWVKVTGDTESYKNGWENSWLSDMKTSIGKVLKVLTIHKSAGYELEDGIFNCSYPAFVCEKAEAPVIDREDGTPMSIPALPTLEELGDHVEKIEYFGTGMKPEDMGDADNYLTIHPSPSEWLGVPKVLREMTHINPKGHLSTHYARVWYKKEPAPSEAPPEIDGWRIDLSKGKWGMKKSEWVELGCDEVIGFANNRWDKKTGTWYGGGDENMFYAPAYRVPVKTELKDLVGEDGQTNAYIINKAGDVAQFALKNDSSGGWMDKEGYCIYEITHDKIRWSHSPFTPYDEANEFIF